MGLPVAVVVGRPALVDHVLDQHPERRPPVADVVLREHVVADEAQEARDRVADDRAPQVADVHLLGDVRRAVVDDDAVRVGGGGNAEARVLEESRDALLEPLAAQSEVDEARARDARRLGDVGEVEVLDELLGELARRAAQLLRERHRGVALVVGAVLRRGFADLRRLGGYALARRLLHRVHHAERELVRDIRLVGGRLRHGR